MQCYLFLCGGFFFGWLYLFKDASFFYEVSTRRESIKICLHHVGFYQFGKHLSTDELINSYSYSYQSKWCFVWNKWKKFVAGTCKQTRRRRRLIHEYQNGLLFLSKWAPGQLWIMFGGLLLRRPLQVAQDQGWTVPALQDGGQGGCGKDPRGHQGHSGLWSPGRRRLCWMGAIHRLQDHLRVMPDWQTRPLWW